MIVIVVVMIPVMVVNPTCNRRPRHIADCPARNGAYRPAYNRAGARPHQTFIEPLAGRRGASGQSDPGQERQNEKRPCHIATLPREIFASLPPARNISEI
jgi:hypothetical protein